MINDDVLIKYSYSHNFGKYSDWVSHVKWVSSQIRDIRDNDFSGIGLSDLDIGDPSQVGVGKRVILCDYLDQNGGSPDHASILGIITRRSSQDPDIIELKIEGIGARPDFTRDLGRELVWGTKIYPNLRNYPTLLFLTPKPKLDGGSIYYYYNKSGRDARINYLPGRAQESKIALMRSILNIVKEDLEDTRGRAQYMHSYRRFWKELCLLLKDLPKDEELREIHRIFVAHGKATHQNSKQLSQDLWELLRKGKNSILDTSGNNA